MDRPKPPPAPRSPARLRVAFLVASLAVLALFALRPKRGETQGRRSHHEAPADAATSPPPPAPPAAPLAEPPPAPPPQAPASPAAPAPADAADDNEEHPTENGLAGACHGPAECCIRDPARVTVPMPERVRLGFRVLTITDINERDGTYMMDAYIMSRWPAGGLFPDLKIRNLGEEANVIDERIFSDGRLCYRARRFQNTFRTWFRLRRFPFDEQQLRLVLEDNLHTREQVIVENEPWPVNYSSDAYRALPDWEFLTYPTLRQRPADFVFRPNGRASNLVILEIPIRRLWAFFLTRYFIPMWLIVCLSYALFWIRLDDVGASSGMGITCVLAIIAFQLTQGDSLPRVPYMTLADRVYSVCYAATAIALLVSLGGAYFDWKGEPEKGERVLMRARRIFPVLFLLGTFGAFYTGWNAQGAREADQNRVLTPPRPPQGETYWSPEQARAAARAGVVRPGEAMPPNAEPSPPDSANAHR